MQKEVVVLGIGYVGLPLAITLAKMGHKVTGVDVNPNVVKSLREGNLTIKETHLEKMFNEPVVKKNFSVSEKPCKADVFIICVQTPMERASKLPDLTCITSAINSISSFLVKGNLVIIESTIPPLTCKKIIKPLIEEKTGLKVGTEVYLAHCPERVMPGETFSELINNNRVIGGITPKSALLAKEVYSSFVKGDIDLTDDVTAEMVKLMENTYRDVNIALANEFSLVAENLGVEGKTAIKLANKHPRVKILSPGIGVGGHCLPKDPWFLIHSDPKNTSIVITAREVNESIPDRVAAKIRKLLKEVSEPKIVALGMSYKPDTDDLRESPAIEIVKKLQEDGYNIQAYDNLIKGHEYSSIKNITKDADCLIVLVEHTAIKEELNETENEIKKGMRTPIILRIGATA
jgi:UDP-N-acetyl-D-mannosaminuronic acid dehydrogenase